MGFMTMRRPALVATLALAASLYAAPALAAPRGWSTLQESFPGLATIPHDGSPVDRGARVTGYLADNVAQVRGAHGSALVVSSSPLRTIDAAGRSHPVDLGLVRSAGAIVLQNAPFELKLRDAASAGFELGPDPAHSVRIVPVHADPAASAATVAGQLFAPDTQPQTDTLSRVTTSGLETFQQLRGPAAPERFEYRVQLRPGQVLRATAEGAVVEQAHKTLLAVSAPLALDAERRPVPIALGVDGDRLVLTVRHRDGGFAYPVLADPNWVAAYDWSRRAGVGPEGWFIDPTADLDFYAPFLLTEPVAPDARNPDGSNSHVGLFITPRGGKVFPPGKQASLLWRAPGSTHIIRADFKDVVELNNRERQDIRLRLAGGPGPLATDDYFTADPVGFERALVTLVSPQQDATFAIVQMFTPRARSRRPRTRSARARWPTRRARS